MVKSSDIAMALCASKWYEEPEKVKKLMLIMMMRCKRILCLQIGPFNNMSLETFLGVSKIIMC
ncbi:hypothetical protein NQ314_004524 [Rhamnusium bicolor]|uniref:Uncharacterized protein n=1 Tax=Rhamnusium bicolor TaxID=1586634 RepID=A0AAV8ZLP9_9CUCU|nr:hypothetical protein NQ314_004524 [Rhamnusium bicolor]